MSKVIELNNGKKIEMREPKVRDMRIVSKYTDEVEKEINLVANLTGMTTAEIDELSMNDYGKLQQGLKDFFS
ncbi:phage tail assembly protein [Aliarcobacter butzleri]|uniref:phage tail assembly protein n=1 Tax=Aliarcobacter butzleri TaxID=28197 RepID=UPI003AFA964E